MNKYVDAFSLSVYIYIVIKFYFKEQYPPG